ncbi:DUF397 domain-containing protein [Streptomyces kunmingensis]|uniref:DUF397 domain-containing protein n=1 Tax=Streptomyces kunmingensis TaxID=68225 RepID=A0ABU6CM62_9ACTN|nr:DUF397 domain-containing protein [Streptomyces kunmingensis]MEB3965147.1 DUF397 domain-containing protein [Streptomyces kunmingensis]
MARSYIWRKSSYSGGGDGNNCVEIAAQPTRVEIRDSKTPDGGILAVPRSVFAAFIADLAVTPPASAATTPM